MDAGDGSPLLNVASAIGSALIFILACMRGTDVLDIRDRVCGGMGLAAIAAGMLSGSNEILVAGCIIASAISVLLLVPKVWESPGRESLRAWLLWLAGSIVYFYTQWEHGTIESLATALAFIIEETIVITILAIATMRKGSLALATNSP